MCRCCGRDFAAVREKMGSMLRHKLRQPQSFCTLCVGAFCQQSLTKSGRAAPNCPGPQRALCSCCGLREVVKVQHVVLRAQTKRDESNLYKRPFHYAKKIKRCETCQLLDCTKSRPSARCPKVLNEKFAPKRVALV